MNFKYSAKTGTNGGANSACNTNTGNGVTHVDTSYGGTGLFNGCWLTILIQIPATYTAPQSGWWKILYNMTGSGTSSDVTTWKVSIRGNPVHLVLP